MDSPPLSPMPLPVCGITQSMAILLPQKTPDGHGLPVPMASAPIHSSPKKVSTCLSGVVKEKGWLYARLLLYTIAGNHNHDRTCEPGYYH